MKSINENEWNDQDGQTTVAGSNFTGDTNTNYENTVDSNEDDEEFEDTSTDGDLDDQLDEEATEDDDETPETKETGNEGSGYGSEPELERPQEGNDTSFSEQTDVTPPSTREFPSVGLAETDFTPDHSRTTGRMVGHEPGTENNL